MSFTIGRVGTSPTLASSAATWSSSGEQVRLTGIISTNSGVTTVAQAVVLRAQLVGLANNLDEPIVPVTWSDDSSQDGYYQVDDVSVSFEPISLSRPYFTYSVSLTRVRGFALPRIESRLIGALRTNSASIVATDTTAWHAIPSAAVDYGGYAFDVITRTSADGAMSVYLDEGSHGTPVYSYIATYTLAPASFYVGAPKIQVGTTLYTATGRQLLNLPYNWSLDNGLVKVTPHTGAKLDVQAYISGAWTTAKTWKLRFTDGVGSSFSDWVAVTTLRNDAEAVAIRLTTKVQSTFTGDPDDRVFLDLLLRRGSRVVQAILHTDTAHTYKIMRDSVEASTAITGGIRATVNDADGYRFVLASPSAVTNDLTNGGVVLSGAGKVLEFAIGVAPTNSAGDTNDNPQSLAYQYMADQGASLRVVDQ